MIPGATPPVFGGDDKNVRDLFIFDIEETNFSQLGYSYQHERYPKKQLKLILF